MTRVTRALLAIFALLLLAGLGAQAQVVQNTNYQLHTPITNQLIFDSCTNQWVTLSGEYFYEYHFKAMANGDTHLHWTSHYNLVGTDANGLKYIGKDQQNYDLKMDPDGTFPPVPTSDFHTSDKFKLIAQGRAPDMTIQSFEHIRVNALGETAIDHEKSPVTKCTGGGCNK